MDRGFLYVLAGGICAGVALRFVCGAELLFAGVLIIVAMLCVCCVYTRKVFVFAIVCAALALGIVRADASLVTQGQETLLPYVGQTVEVEGNIADDPDRREKSLRLKVAVERVGDVSAKGMLLALAQRDAEVSYGDTVVVRGKITAPQAFETDTGHTFDYPNYLAVQGISAQMQYATLEEVHTAGLSLQGSLFAIKHAFEGSLERLFPEPDGSLMEGILLGEKHGIPQDLTNAFIASGLIHVVVLSGYNISIVAEGVFRLLAFLPRLPGFATGGVLMILFALMAGSGAATVRALCMALIALVARYLHRPTLALRALMVAVVGMVWWNPYVLLHDPSFMLSVLATFGLVALSPWVESWLAQFRLLQHKRLHNTRSILASTIAVEIFVVPALLYFSGVLSFFALPANVLVLGLVPAAMLLGFVAGLLGWISPVLGFLPALAADVIIKWMLWVATSVAHLPFSTAIIPEFSGWIVFAVYIPLTWFAASKYKKSVDTKDI